MGLTDDEGKKTQYNPKMMAEKFKNRARKLPTKYTVKQGDSWAKIAGNIYGELYDYDPMKSQRMAEDLARRNNKVRGLTPGTVIRIARPRQNPYVSAEFMGQAAPVANQVAQPGYTGSAPVGQTPAGAVPNYNSGSYQGRPWAVGAQGQAPSSTLMKTRQDKSYGKSAELPWNPNADSLLFDTSGQPRPQFLPGYTGSNQVIGGAGGGGGTNPVYDRTYLPGKEPTTQTTGLGYGNYKQPTVTKTPQPEPVSASRQKLIDRGYAMDPNEPVGFTSVVDQELAAGIRPIFIYEADRVKMGIPPEDMELFYGYTQNPMTGSWIRIGPAQMSGTLPAPTYSDAYSGGFRGYGGGGGPTSRGGTSYGGGGYTGYGSGYNTNQAGQYTQADRMIREAAIGLISWRI